MDVCERMDIRGSVESMDGGVCEDGCVCVGRWIEVCGKMDRGCVEKRGLVARTRMC